MNNKPYKATSLVNHLVAQLLSWQLRTKSSAKRHGQHLIFDSLEERVTPANFIVNELADSAQLNVGTNDPTSTTGLISLRSALAAANVDAANDVSGTISFNLGSNPQSLTLSEGVFEVLGEGEGTISIDGGGLIALDGNNTSAVFDIAEEASVTLQNLTIKNGLNSATGGGGIKTSGTLTVTNCTFTGNISTAYNAGGGAIYNDAFLTINGSTFRNNSGVIGGAITSTFNGGLTVTNVSNSFFVDNSATDSFGGGGGGAIFNNGHFSTITNSTFTGNKSNQDGGDIYNNSRMTIIGSTFSGGKSGAGSGFFVGGNGGSILNNFILTFTDSAISNSSAIEGIGGAMVNQGTLTVSNSTLVGNTAERGGGIASNNQFTVDNSAISSNTANNEGGAIFVDEDSFGTITGSILSKNTAPTGGGGGAILNDGTLTVSTSTLSGNSAGIGGAIHNSGQFTLSHSTLLANVAPEGSGGGVFNGTVMTVVSSTFAANAADFGGGLYNEGNLTISGSTFSRNHATVGGGIDNSGPLTLLNTIVAGNTASSAPDTRGSVATAHFNLIGNNVGLTGITNGTNGNKVGTATSPINPQLTVLGDYGGPTQTFGLLAGSPALGVGGAVTTLSQAIDEFDEFLVVAKAAAIASTDGNYVIQIDNEQILVTSVSLADNTLTVERGYNGTTAVAHNSAANVILAFDQRGAAAVVGGNTNIGAFAGFVDPNPLPAPTATLNATAVTPDNFEVQSPYTFSIVYQGNTFVAAASVKRDTIYVQSPTGARFTARLTNLALSGSLNGLGDATTVTATYSFSPPNGDWQQMPAGLYRVILEGPALSDTSGNVMVRSQDGSGNLLPLNLGGFQNTTTVAGPTVIVSATNPIAPSTVSQTSVSGYGVPGTTVSLTATDGIVTTSDYSTVVGSDGTWQIGGVNVSGLNDGRIYYNAILSTEEGPETETISATKDTHGSPVSMIYHVSPGVGQLQAAINQALANDIGLNLLILAEGTYDLANAFADSKAISITYHSSVLSKAIVIQGAGMGKTIIQPGDGPDSLDWNERIFNIVDTDDDEEKTLTVEMDRLTIRGGNVEAEPDDPPQPAQGGGLLIDGAHVTLSELEVTDNRVHGAPGIDGGDGADGVPGAGAQHGGAAQGGGIYLADGTLILIHVAVNGNYAVGGDGGNAGSGGKAENGEFGDFGVPGKSGKNGGPGANGGNGTTGKGSGPNGDGSQGGIGGTGGDGGAGEGGGVFIEDGVFNVFDSVISGNLAQGGQGGAGGGGAIGGSGGGPPSSSGTGGRGGSGGAGRDTNSVGGNGGNGGNGAKGVAGVEGGEGGEGAEGGEGGEGGKGSGGGVFIEDGEVTIKETALANNLALGGYGGNGGGGGSGGRGGDGEVGGGYSGGDAGSGGSGGSGENQGGKGGKGGQAAPNANGGEGGTGGDAAEGGSGGGGGEALGGGVFVGGGTLNLIAANFSNDVAQGGTGGKGGRGGSGGKGGVGGQGGVGGYGGNGGSGGAGTDPDTGKGGAGGAGTNGARGGDGADGGEGGEGEGGGTGGGGGNGLGGGLFQQAGTIKMFGGTLSGKAVGGHGGDGGTAGVGGVGGKGGRGGSGGGGGDGGFGGSGANGQEGAGGAAANGGRGGDAGDGGESGNGGTGGSGGGGGFAKGGGIVTVSGGFTAFSRPTLGGAAVGGEPGVGGAAGASIIKAEAGEGGTGGSKGFPGFGTPNGALGTDGEKGEDGEDGEAGTAGRQGPRGLRGGNAGNTSTISMGNESLKVRLEATDVLSTNAAAQMPYTFTLTFNTTTLLNDGAVIDATVQIKTPTDQIIEAVLTDLELSGNTNELGDASILVGTYQFIPPDADWLSAPNGLYEVQLVGTTIADLAGNTLAHGTIGSFVNFAEADDDAKAAIQGNFAAKVIVPSQLSANQPGLVYVEYSNIGNVPFAAPLLVLSATQNDQHGAFITFDSSLAGTSYNSNVMPAGYSDSLQLLASGANAGMLLPGETRHIPVYYGGWLNGSFNTSLPITFDLGVLDTTNTEAINWGTLAPQLQPSYISNAAWSALVPNLAAQLGSTWGEFVQRLNSDAVYFAGLGQSITDVNKLLGFELNKANASYSAPATSNISVASFPAPGMALTFNASFQSTISGRYSLGRLGYGWSSNWDMTVTTEPNGDVAVEQNGAPTLYFKRKPDGSFALTNGNSSPTLAFISGAYRVTDASGQILQFNNNGTLHSISDTNSNTITASYNGLNQLEVLTHTSGAFLNLTYNPQGFISSVTDSAGQLRTFGYDGSGQLTTFTNEYGTTTFNYVTSGTGAQNKALASVVHPTAATTFYNYDTFGRLIQQHANDGINTTTVSYTSAGRMVSTNALGQQSSVSLNLFGNAASTVDALGNVTQYIYNQKQQLIKMVGPHGATSVQNYNPAGQLTSSTDPLGRTVFFSHDARGNILSNTDAKGQTTKYTYDAFNNLQTITYANGTQKQYTYNALGQATQYLNANSQPLNYTFNTNGQVLTQTFADNTSYTYTYDARGNMTSVTDAQSRMTTFSYGNVTQPNLLTAVNYPDGTWLQFSYNPAGLRTQSLDQAGFATNYEYDAVGRLSKLTDGSSNLIVQYTYDAVGKVSQEDRGNGTRTTYRYDVVGNLLSLKNLAPDHVTVNSFNEYTYDVFGNVSSDTNQDGQWIYTYDGGKQLTEAVFTPNATNPHNLPPQHLQYAYDTAGNRISETVNGVTTTYVVNNVNQYTSSTTNGVNTSYQYDNIGNMLAKSSGTSLTNYTYDQLNQLIGVNGTDFSASYAFNALGGMVSQSVNGTTTNYQIDPAGTIAASFTGTGVYTNSSLLAHYTHGYGLVSQVNATNAAAYYDYNKLGNTVGMTNASGSYVNEYSYLPFGQTNTINATVDNPFTFVGRFGVLNNGSGLFHMGARAFDTGLGQFTSNDPLGIVAGDMNLRRYVANSPTNAVDPLGLEGPIDALWPLLETTVTVLDPSTAQNPALQTIVSTSTAIIQSLTTIGAASYNHPLNSIADSGSKDVFKNFYRAQDGSKLLGGAGKVAGTVAATVGSLFNGYSAGTKLQAGDVAGSVHDAWLGITGVIGFALPWAGLLTGASDLYTRAAFDVPEFQTGWNETFGRLIPASKFVELSDEEIEAVQIMDTGVYNYGVGDVKRQVTSKKLQTLLATFDLPNEILTTTIRWSSPNIPPGERIDVEPQTAANGVLPPIPTNGSLGSGPLPTVSNTGTYATPGCINWLEPGAATWLFDPTYFMLGYQLNPNLPSGTIINVEISYAGETGAATILPAYSFTIDNDAPKSRVGTLPATSSTSFNVSWLGEDNSDGSELAYYNIFVSENGGPATLWKAKTTDTSAQFTGQLGHTYSFYSVAVDLAGNIESKPTAPQAITTVTTNGTALTQNTNATPAVITVKTLLGTQFSDPDGPVNPNHGIAVVQTIGDGTWQYSTNGKTWTNMDAVSATRGLLLSNKYSLRFLPATITSGQAQLTYHAWDASQGQAGSYFNITTTGGGSAFSSANGALSVTINPVPVWIGSGAALPSILPGTYSTSNNTIPAGDTVARIFGKYFDDDRPTTSMGIAVTAVTGANNGTWQYSTNGGTSWTTFPLLSKTAALLLDANDLVRFVPKNGFAGTATFAARAWDGSGGALGATVNPSTLASTAVSPTTINATVAINNAPTLSANAAPLPAIPATGTSTATKVSAMLAKAGFADPNGKGKPSGLAIIDAGDSPPGAWQYMLTGGKWLPLLEVSESSGFLLPSTASLRFVANQQIGSATLTFRAWDQTQGITGNHFNMNATGGVSAFSTATATLVATVRQTTTWNAASGAKFTPLLPGTYNVSDPTSPSGDTIATVFENFFQPNNPTIPVGVAVVGLTGTANGTWQYSGDDGASWENFPAVTKVSALLLSSEHQVRFVPKNGFVGTVSLSARAWDGSVGKSETKVNPAKLGTAFSTTTHAATCSVNRAPTLTTATVTLPAVKENITSPIVTASTLLSKAGYSDLDGTKVVSGIAIVGVNGPGTWQRKKGTVWLPISSSVSSQQALLLASATQIRFVPNNQLPANTNGAATLTYFAWDQTMGISGDTFAVQTQGGATGFSATSATATIPVNDVQQAPTWAAGATATFTPVLGLSQANLNPDPSGDTVAALFGNAFRGAPGMPVGIAVSGLTGLATGEWQYSVNGGANWITIATASAQSAVLLSANVLLRYVPNKSFSGTVTLTANAWDGTGTQGQSVPVVSGTTFSPTKLTASCVINLAPTLSP